jgi:hypothetical protein
MNPKKVLILAYDFPPYVSVGGLRPYSWYKYLNEFKVYPIVITRQWSNNYGNHLDYIAPSKEQEVEITSSDCGTIIRTPYKPNRANRLMLKHGVEKHRLRRKLITAYYELFQYVFPVGPKLELYLEAKKYLQNNKVDVILASGEPFVLLKYASKLSKEFNIPWIADYRDSWVQKAHIQNNFLLKTWYTCVEKKVLKSVNKITTVSDFLKHEIAFANTTVEFEIIPNGFDYEFADNAKKIKQNDKTLSFVLTGSIYDWHPIRSFLSHLNNFIVSNNYTNIRLFLYGINMHAKTIGTTIEELISEEYPHLLGYCVFHEKLSNEELLVELANLNVMVLFNDYSLMGTKIFDYIGINRTILFCFENDEDAMRLKRKYFNMKERQSTNDRLQIELIKRTQAGYIVKDAQELNSTFEMLYNEFSKNKFIACNTINTEEFSRKRQAKKLACLIEDVLKN